jgi:protoporphyrinogen/coproporphyrinogen III oxidase
VTSIGSRQAPRVVVVGAGISGLAAAAAVRRERPDVDVVVLEAADRVGGKLRLDEVAGVTLDVGAESILNRRPEGVDLAGRSGLADRLTHPATIEARIWSRGRLHRMPRSVLGVPADPEELAAGGLLSEAGLDRALQEPERPATSVDGDVSIGWLVEERFGTEVLDRLVEPLLGGVYAGHARRLSARAAAPQVLALLEEDHSMLRAAAAATARKVNQRPVFAGIEGGVGQLPEAVAAGLDVRLRTTVRELDRRGRGWELLTGPVPAPERLGADAVIVAVPAPAAARLVRNAAPVAAEALSEIECASMAVVTLAFPAARFPTVAGSGFLVPPVEGRLVKAATFSSAKWGWVREAAPDLVLMRASVGRHGEEQVLQRADEELVERVLLDLGDAVGLMGRPVDWHVQRWGGGLPQYAVGHLDRVRRVREGVRAAAGLAVCGAAYDGVGIPACIASGELAARQVLHQLPRPGGRPPHDPVDGPVNDPLNGPLNGGERMTA